MGEVFGVVGGYAGGVGGHGVSILYG
jgi:hypothetical protein